MDKTGSDSAVRPIRPGSAPGPVPGEKAIMSTSAQPVVQSAAVPATSKTGPAAVSLAVGRSILLPVIGMVMFLALWHAVSYAIQTSLGKLPGPLEVWEQSGNLYQEYRAERAREVNFYLQQEERKAEFVAQNPDQPFVTLKYTGTPTFFDQILTSVKTVATGFLLGVVIAIPLGIVCGLSAQFYAAINPLVQVLRPVSPLAWLPIVTMTVSAMYITQVPGLPKSFVISAFTVMLCCLWPTLINTTIGVSSVSRDLVNVARVLRLGWFTNVRRIVLPSALPMIFAGMRVSLGIGWMVLIATEMLAQNPGLGKFIWDEFQNGSSQSLARIMVAVVVIGIVGFLLDRLMLVAQRRVGWDKQAILR
jgi:nitrate/nitrite transport system permease protein